MKLHFSRIKVFNLKKISCRQPSESNADPYRILTLSATFSEVAIQFQIFKQKQVLNDCFLDLFRELPCNKLQALQQES